MHNFIFDNYEDYKSTFELACVYSKLGKQAHLIMDCLFPIDVFDVTYTDIAERIGIDTSNTRKALRRLESLGVINICYKYYEDESKNHKNNPMIACFIVDGWMDNLLANKNMI